MKALEAATKAMDFLKEKGFNFMQCTKTAPQPDQKWLVVVDVGFLHRKKLNLMIDSTGEVKCDEKAIDSFLQSRRQSSMPITVKTQIFSFDVESNGLLGQAFAVGAVIVDLHGTLLHEFIGRCPIEGEVAAWVKENVLPKLLDVPVKYNSLTSLQNAFWHYLQAHKEKSIIAADFGYPVEAKFLLECQLADLPSRKWHAPYPLHEVGTLLLAAGIDPDINREEYAEITGLKHNPLHDAYAAALCTLKALRTIKGIK